MLRNRVEAAFEQAWIIYGATQLLESDLPDEVVEGVDAILANNSAPNRQMLLTIAAGTAEFPASNPASNQVIAGVDRRGQAKVPRDVLARFIEKHGLTLKMSKDPGVSNPWRESIIDDTWVIGRRGKDRLWANGFLQVVSWLNQFEPFTRGQKSQELLEYVALRIVDQAVSNALNYPRFPASPRLAMDLTMSFLQRAHNSPDALEAIVTAASRVLAHSVNEQVSVVRGDTNSPDAIDIVISTPDESVNAGIEVTDEFITLSKLQHEVLPAMLQHGLDRATVISRGVRTDDRVEIDSWIRNVFVTTSQRIDLLTVSDIETWLSFPGTPASLSTLFLREVGDELDRYSGDANRRDWYSVLTEHISEVI